MAGQTGGPENNVGGLRPICSHAKHQPTLTASETPMRLRHTPRIVRMNYRDALASAVGVAFTIMPGVMHAQTQTWAVHFDSRSEDRPASVVGTAASLSQFNAVAPGTRGLTWLINGEMLELRAIRSDDTGRSFEIESLRTSSRIAVPQAIATTRDGTRLFILDRRGQRLIRLDATALPPHQLRNIVVDGSVRDMCSLGNYVVTVSDGAVHKVNIYSDEPKLLRSFTLRDPSVQDHPLTASSAARLTCLGDGDSFLLSGVFTPTLILADIQGKVKWTSQLQDYRMLLVEQTGAAISTSVPPGGHHFLVAVAQVKNDAVAVQLGLRTPTHSGPQSDRIETHIVDLNDGTQTALLSHLPRVVGSTGDVLWLFSNGYLRRGHFLSREVAR